MEPMFSLKLGIDLIAGASAGVTVGAIAPTANLWPASLVTLALSLASGLLLGYLYYKKYDENK